MDFSSLHGLNVAVELASEFEVREALPNTWHPFLAKFGRLTGIQRRAMIPIAGGCSALVCAPTASGKTEAVVVPLIERLWGEGVGKGEERKALVVMVSPTRALANDLFRRLQGLIGRRGDLTLSIRTGDQRVSDRGTREGEELGGAQGPTIMLVTPESLDSYLTRKPAELRRVLAVVLDELHLLQASGRGDQLSGLLSRLEKVSPGFQRCALSATVADPEGLARRFLGQGARVLRVGEGVGQGEEGSGDGQRALSLSLLPIYTEEDAPKAVIGTLSQPQTRKVLVFVNRRQDAERLTAQLRARKPSVEAVLIHHGSLERAHRRQTEAQLLSLRSWICVATMTLELGVDIGDIDQIVLLNPAPDTSSFMQRVGRAKRRGGVIQALGLYESEFERQRLLFQESNGRAGRNFSEMFPFRPWVVVQQALSMMYQFRGKRAISAQALWNRLPPDAAARYPEHICHTLLQEVARAGLLRPVANGEFVPEPMTDTLFTRGELHSTLETAPSLKVVDQLTGQTLGEIGPRRFSPQHAHASHASLPSLPAQPPSHVHIAGRSQHILSLDNGVLKVRAQNASSPLTDSLFAPKGSPICSPSEAAAFGQWLGHPPQSLRWTPCPLLSDDTIFLQHFLGTLRGYLLRALLKHLKLKVLQGHPAFGWWVKDSPHLRTLLSAPFGAQCDVRSTLLSLLSSQSPSFLDRLQPGPLAQACPPPLLDAWLCDVYALDSLSSLLSQSPWVETPILPWMLP